MQEKIEKTKKNIEEILRKEEEHQDKKIDFILINPDTRETLTIASNGYDSMIYFAPYTIDEKNKYVSVADWEFSFDQYLFQDLQKGYQIGYMTDETHYNLWNTIQEYYPEDIKYKDGVQCYLQYCANRGITKEYLNKKLNLDAPDILNFFEEKDILTKYGLNGEDKFRYIMLSRLQADCKYFLGNGNRNNKDLWAKDPKEHIKIMKALYNSLPTPPDWITVEEIKNFEKELNKENKQKKSKERNER